MQLPSIGTLKHVEHLKEHLGYEFRTLEKEGVHIVMSQRSHGAMQFIDLDVVNSSTAIIADNLCGIVKGHVAQALSEVIVDEIEETTIRRILKRDYIHFPPKEQADVESFVVRELKADAGDPISDRKTRRHRVLDHVLDYLSAHNEIILEGFIRFRLKEYINQLENAVDHAVDEYLMEKEYGEFIRLLRYFVDTQEPGADISHVVISANGKFWLADADGKRINSDAIDDLVVEIADGDIEYEDVLMSNLITLAPRRVVVHNPGAVESTGSYLDTIRNVFGSRVSMCKGCDLCNGMSVQQHKR